MHQLNKAGQREAALATKAGNYRARAAGTYGPGSVEEEGRRFLPMTSFDLISGSRQSIRGRRSGPRRAAAVQQRNLRELVSGSKQAAAGVRNIARAFVYLGVSGEENVEKRPGSRQVRGGNGRSSRRVGRRRGLSKASRAYRALRSRCRPRGWNQGRRRREPSDSARRPWPSAAASGSSARLYLGEQQFANFTDWTGATTLPSRPERSEPSRVATTANKQMRRRGQLAERWADETTLARFDVADAEVRGGLESGGEYGAGRSLQRSATNGGVKVEDPTGRAGNIEEFSARLASRPSKANLRRSIRPYNSRSAQDDSQTNR